jgi:hypothetical protein
MNDAELGYEINRSSIKILELKLSRLFNEIAHLLETAADEIVGIPIDEPDDETPHHSDWQHGSNIDSMPTQSDIGENSNPPVDLNKRSRKEAK